VVTSLIGSVGFVWLGMVLAISFLETPLKFRAPGVSLRLGLGIGRVVFRAFNRVEVVFALVLVGAVIPGPHRVVTVAAVGAAAVVLAVQLLLVRPRLNRRSDRVLAGEEDLPRSRAHYGYVALELAKLAALGVAGASALGG
jgi:predicted membrane-bound spermidine synthase